MASAVIIERAHELKAPCFESHLQVVLKLQQKLLKFDHFRTMPLVTTQVKVLHLDLKLLVLQTNSRSFSSTALHLV
jgi:hypothetical protein